MSIHTPGILPATVLLRQGRPARFVRGGATVDAFRAPALRDPRTLALAARVEVREDPALTAELPALRPAWLRLLLRDGRCLQTAVDTNRGDAENPHEAAEIVAKFHELSTPIRGAEQAERIAAAVDALDGCADVAPLHALLAAPPRGGDA